MLSIFDWLFSFSNLRFRYLLRLKRSLRSLGILLSLRIDFFGMEFVHALYISSYNTSMSCSTVVSSVIIVFHSTVFKESLVSCQFALSDQKLNSASFTFLRLFCGGLGLVDSQFMAPEIRL